MEVNRVVQCVHVNQTRYEVMMIIYGPSNHKVYKRLSFMGILNTFKALIKENLINFKLTLKFYSITKLFVKNSLKSQTSLIHICRN